MSRIDRRQEYTYHENENKRFYVSYEKVKMETYFNKQRKKKIKTQLNCEEFGDF